MGIKGLSSFALSSEESVFKPLKLKNSYLVIDGNNVKHKLYMSLCSFRFGGDYEVYYKRLKNLFLDFKKCNVTPIVVWDGVTESEKQSLRIRRWFKTIQLLKYINCNETSNIYPMFYSHVFIDVLDELKIMHVTCLGEADREVAIIGNILQCPVLSSDSDFFCFDVQFIPFPKMDFYMKEDSSLGPGHEYYFDCYIFDRVAFMKQYGITKDMFMLLPVLLTDEHSQNCIFENFLGRLLNFTSPSYIERLTSVLKWMRGVGSYDDALSLILTDTDKCERKKMLDVIQNVFEHYENLNKPISPYIKINKTELKIEIDEDIEQEMLPKDHILSRYPKYVINSFIKNIIKSVFIKVASEAIIFSCIQWEDINECATSLISMPILSGSLQIMKRVLGEDITKTIIVRIGRNYRKVLMYNSENFLTGITSEIFTAEENERKRVLFQVVDFGESEKRVVNEIGRDWSIFIVSILYWMKNRERYLRCKKFEARKLNSVVMTALASHAECLKNGNPLASSFLSEIPDWELSDFGDKLEELRKGEPGIEYSLSIIHDFALLQTSINSIMSLNAILNTPFPKIQIHKFFAGRTAHDLCQLMGDPNYADKALMATRTIRDLYYRLIEIISTAVPIITD